MSSLNTYNLNMLNECLKKVHYTNQAKVRSDMLEAMNKLQTLQPRVGFINFTNGTKKQLLCIYGTIPMMHNGNKYNIPMNFWIPEMYPQSAPLTFVDPTENMMIKEKHKHVDSQGRCYSPYLSRWTPVSCNFLGLINDLSEIFNGDPPVFQKPASTTPPPSSTSTPYNNRMYTQPQPQQQQPPSTQYTPSPTPTQSSNYSYQQQPHQQPPPVSYATTTLNGTNNNNSHTTTTSPIPTTTSPSPTTIQNNEKNQLIQKVRTSCATVVQELQERIDSDMQVFSKLTSRANELTAQEMKLGIDENSNTTNTTIPPPTSSPFHLLQQERNVLSEREQSLNKWIDSHEHKELDVDKMIEPEDMHSRQILELLAEENSIDDLVWILGEALHKGNMDCDTYLTRVRQLGREQFMKKALLLKLSYKL